MLEKDLLWLVEIEQISGDLLISLDTPTGQYQVSTPASAVTPIWFFLGPFSEETTIDVSAESRLSAEPQKFNLTQRVIDGQYAEYARLINRASELYVTEGNSSLVIDLYVQAAEQSLLAPDLKNYATQLAANAALSARRPNQARQIIERLEFNQDCAQYCYQYMYTRALIEFETDQFIEANNYFAQALELVDTDLSNSGKNLVYAELLLTYGFSLTLTGQSERGLTYIEQARLLSDEHENIGFSGRTASIESGYHAFNGHYLQARQVLIDGREALESGNDHTALAELLINLATIELLLGEYNSGIIAAQKALEIIQTLDNPTSLIGPLYDRLAILYKALGDIDKSIHFLDLSFQQEINNGRVNRAMSVQVDLASAMRERGNPKLALSKHQQSLDYFLERGEIGKTVVIYQEIARDLMMDEQWIDANTALEKARELRALAPGFIRLDNLELEQARILEHIGEPVNAIRLLQNSLINLEQSDVPLATIIDYNIALMTLLRKFGDKQEALNLGHKTLELVNNVRMTIEVRRLGPAWSRKTHSAVTELASIYLDAFLTDNNIELAFKAFQIVETTQSIALRNQISASVRLDSENNTDTTITNLERELTGIANQRASATPGSQALETLTTDYYKALETLETTRAKQYGQQGIELFPKDALERFPKNNTGLKFFCPQANNCWLFSIRQNYFDAIKLNSDDLEDLSLAVHHEITENVTAHSVQTAQPDNRIQPYLEQLSERLGLTELIAEAGEDHTLWINADYPISLVPFAALPVINEGTKQSKNAEDGQKSHLIDYVNLISTPSLWSLIADEEIPDTDHNTEIAILADPRFKAAELNEQNENSANHNWSQAQSPLPWTGEEARLVSALYEGQKIAVYTEEDANRSNLLSPETRNARILHIATHAYYRPATSDLVGIALSPENHVQGGGFVTLNDLATHPFNNELVIISGCETATGEYFPGEGEMSLARTFHAQGARSVVATKWPVSDRTSALFMQYFHQAMQVEKASPEAALRSAQQQIRLNPRYQSPFYWAGYSLSIAR